MTFTLLALLILICVTLLAWGYRKPERMLHYPFLAGCVFTGFVYPQLLGLSMNSEKLPPYALDKTIFMTILCIGACYLGHTINKTPFQFFNWPFDNSRLLTAATILSLSGAYFFFKVSELAEGIMTNRWTGIVTIFVFLSTTLTIGLAIALAVHTLYPSRWSLAIIIFDVAFYLHRIVFLGRRRFTFEFIIMLGLVFWFRFRKLPSRLALVTIIILFTFWINSVGDYRTAVIGEESGGFKDVFKIDFVGNLQGIASEGGHDLTNAVYNIEAFDRRGNFDMGLRHWNGFIDYHVPGQFVGYDIKRNLMVNLDNAALKEFNYRPKTGSTNTGISDSFLSFWYFGAIKFLVIAYVMRSLFRAANRNSLVALILLMLIYSGALESITHNTGRFFIAWFRIIAFLGPSLLFAKEKKLGLEIQPPKFLH